MKKEKLTYNDFVKNIADSIKDKIKNGAGSWDNENFNRDACLSASVNAKENLYSGVNSIVLLIRQWESGFKSNQWATFKQLKEMGANVLKGEKATDVFFFTQYIKTETAEESKNYWVLDENNHLINKFITKGEKFRIQVKCPRLYKVFNLSQTNLKEEENAIKINADFEKILNQHNPDIQHHEIGKAFYRVTEDQIRIPNVKHFKTHEDYQATLLHELCHWTLHENRLNRQINFKCKKSYALEELTAEISCKILMKHFNITGAVRNHEAYIESWLSILTDEDFQIAVKQSSKVISYLLNFNLNEALKAA